MTSEPVGNTPRPAMPTGNAHKQRVVEPPPSEPREPVQKIIEGKVVLKRPNVFKRAARTMVADDVTNVGDFVVQQVLVPAIRNLIYDIGSQGLHQVLFGTARGRRAGVPGSRDPGGGSLKTAYHRVSGSDPTPDRGISREAAARHNFDDIFLDDRAEAVDVLESLIARVERYGSATVADLYDFLGFTAVGFPDQKWGWTDLSHSNSEVRQTRQGYAFDLPRPIVLR